MAVSLNYTVVERNDSKTITFTDTSTGWNTGGDPNFTSIRALTSHTYALTLGITITSSTSAITYDDIDLYTIAPTVPFTQQSDMVFTIDASKLKISGVAIGDSNTELPDGIWDVTYNLLTYSGSAFSTTRTFSQGILIYGVVKSKVYNRLRQVPNLYQLQSSYREINEIAFYNTYLESIQKSAFVAKRTELIAMLETLQRLLLNGSNYPW